MGCHKIITMKKHITILAFLLTVLVRGFAQDTITGVVSRVAAPYFEQNVCDSRFALVSEGETYYVMVDGYWPNPYLENLVVHYDTIPVGAEMEVVGNILEMEDENGALFKVIDVNQQVNSENVFFYSCILWMGGFYPIAYPGPETTNAYAIVDLIDNTRSFVTIDGNLQTNYTWVVNGVSLNRFIRYLFVGSYETWTDYYGESFSVFNLKEAFPYGEDTDLAEGRLTLDNSLCLTTLNENPVCLSIFDGSNHYYLTIKDSLLSDYINSDLYGENDPVSATGVEALHYDMFGGTFRCFEIVELQIHSEKTLSGILLDAPMPNVGTTPVPGTEMAYYSGSHFYYIDNQVLDYPYSVIIGNDTVCYGAELTAVFTSRTRIDNGFEPYYNILISEATITTGLQESSSVDIMLYPNPNNGIFTVIGKNLKHVDVFDVLGQRITSLTANNDQTTIDLSGHPAGVYLINVTDKEGKLCVKKVVKH